MRRGRSGSGCIERMHKLTRISYNSANWQKPTGEARQYEGPRTYNHKHGFGHEDWLFRSEWLVDGWRYAFLQGVNKSRRKLVKARQPFDVTLFTVEPKTGHRFVATIYDVECLDNQQSRDALEIFKQRGWLATMGKEIRDVSGDDSALGDPKWANDILNIRFRQDNVKPFFPITFTKRDDPIRRLNRYQLYDAANVNSTSELNLPVGRAGSSSLPAVRPYKRKGTAAVECTPEHARMQEKLMKELAAEYPDASITREEDFVDVAVRTQHELILFEIKSDLEPRTVIRQALGQILEYAYYPNRRETLPVKLVIVGRGRLSDADRDYLNRLKQEFHLPIEYRAINPE
jgi:hypothetical protein